MSGVRSYFSKHAYRNTVLADLLVELEAASGRDLATWSQQWLQTAGVNILRPVLSTDDVGTITAFSISQETPEQHSTLRAQRVGVGFYSADETGALVRTFSTVLDVDGASTEVAELVGRARPDLVLVNDQDLGYAKLRLDPVSLETALEKLGRIADPLARALVWGAVWDAARDGEIPARDYVDLVLNHVGSETDSSVIKVQLAQLTTALRRYVAADAAADTAAAAAERLWDLANAAEAGSDAQFQFVMKFSALASTAQQLDHVAALRSGETTLAGLEIDTDLGWELLISLVAGGRAGEDEIAEALAADRTAGGELAATLARAAVPTAEAKAAAWDAVITEGKLSNTLQRRVVTGFDRTHDAALLEPFAEAYFGAVRGLWESRSYESAQTLITGLYPSRPTSAATLERTDALLAELGEDLPALSRLLAEARDGMARALRAQEADAAR